ncbi:Ig domain-containing protein [Paucibacter sp. KCTC 42545]|uniref:Ig domain-containing protein n=1 Tax=Paucibacter sp. KCTC 42545 TaxID=1768242 RepID=UPI0012E361D9|nr:Ig domain-containing protein [Paucibacter sp. KCTC 42545]
MNHRLPRPVAALLGLALGLLGLPLVPASTPVPAPVSSPASTATSAPAAAATASSAVASTSTKPASLASTLPACSSDASASASSTAKPATANCLPNPTFNLDISTARLPSALVGRQYLHQILALGGQAPLSFALAQGQLPLGLSLSETGAIFGKPSQPETQAFEVRLSDADGRSVTQAYTLKVSGAPGASKPTAAASSASAPKPAPPLKTLSAADAQGLTPEPPRTAITTYQLPANFVEQLKAAAEAAQAAEAAAAAEAAQQAAQQGTEPLPSSEPSVSAASTAGNAATARPAAGAASANPSSSTAATAAAEDMPVLPAAQLKQIEKILQPLLGVEYPTRHLFEAALDAQLCQFSRALLNSSAAKEGKTPPSDSEFARACPPDWAALARKPPAPAQASKPLAWQDLAPSILPPDLRRTVINLAAAKPAHPVGIQTPIVLDGADCACLRDDLTQPIIAFYPAWLAPAPDANKLDFSMINRINFFALGFAGESLADARPQDWPESHTQFIREARRHGSKIDFTIYRNDWQFLATEPAGERAALTQRMLDQIPPQARALIDSSLQDLASRAKAAMPGFGEVQTLGDGITLFFDEAPAGNDPLRPRFEDFFHRFVLAMASELKKGGRPYALNIVVPDHLLGVTGSYDIARLFDFIKAVEEPRMQEDRIAESKTPSGYEPGSQVTLRFIVLLSEPSKLNKKTLRALIENAPELHGNNRRIFLRKIVPLLSLPQANEQQLDDDLIYAEDNFGGIAFWPLPLAGEYWSPAAAKSLLAVFSSQAGNSLDSAICSFVCIQRWWVRLAFELLLLIGLLSVLLLQLSCELRAKYGRYALLGGVPTLIVGAMLLHCDPALARVREGSGQTIVMLGLLLALALWTLFKPKVKPP